MQRRSVLGAAVGLATAPLVGGLARPALAQTPRALCGSSPRLPSHPSTRCGALRPSPMCMDTWSGTRCSRWTIPRPAAAGRRRAEVSADELTWTITLRDGLIFHDNVPVLARDAVASVKRWSQKDPIGQTIAAITDEIKAIDDKRFQIILRQPFRTMLFSLGLGNIFVQPERIANVPASEQFKEVIGSGPYRFLADEFQAGATAHYARWDKYVPRNEPPDFWSGEHVANFDRVEWTAKPDPATAAAALQRGEVDWLERPLLDLMPMLSKARALRSRLSIRSAAWHPALQPPAAAVQQPGDAARVASRHRPIAVVSGVSAISRNMAACRSASSPPAARWPTTPGFRSSPVRAALMKPVGALPPRVTRASGWSWSLPPTFRRS